MRIVKYIFLSIILIMLSGCAITRKYNQYIIIKPIENDNSYKTLIRDKAKVRVSGNRKKVTFKIGNDKRKYKISDYRYTYRKYVIFKTKEDRTGIVIETTTGEIIRIKYNYNYTTLNIPREDNCDLTDTIYWLDDNYNL